jgi:hypothetical protein
MRGCRLLNSVKPEKVEHALQRQGWIPDGSSRQVNHARVARTYSILLVVIAPARS